MRAATRALFNNSSLVPPTPTPSVVTFDSAGTGGITPTQPLTWTHNIVAANKIFIPFQFFTTVGFDMVVKINGTTVTPLSTVPSINWYSSGGFFGYYGALEIATADTPPPGLCTFSVAFTGGAPYNWTSNSIAYRNVGSVGTVVRNTSTGPAWTLLGTTASSKGTFLNMFSTTSAGTAARISNYNQISRWNQPLETSSLAMLIGDAPDRGSDVAFTMNIPDADFVIGFTLPLLAA